MAMKRFRFLTSGESHGKCLKAIFEGVPAGIRIKADLINDELAKRQVGYGRGQRMQIEKDTVEIKSGVRQGKTTGAPICLEIKNKDFANWEDVMSVQAYDYPTEEMVRNIEAKAFTKARPGHADFAGSKKYNLSDLRDVLERSSARKTAIEVAVGAIAKQILREFGIMGFSHVVQIGNAKLDFYPKTYTRIKEKDYTLALYPLTGEYNSPVSVIEQFVTEKNLFNYSNLKVDSAFNSLKNIAGFDNKIGDILYAEQTIISDFDFIPVFYKSEFEIMSGANNDIMYLPFTKQLIFRYAKYFE